ncbi:MAG: 50S ribosomal protein L1, partial [Solirubrobacteraceae bacterium]
MAKHGKAYVQAKQRFDRSREYAPAEAIALVKQLGSAKFNESVEVHIRTGLNVRHADEQLRG